MIPANELRIGNWINDLKGRGGGGVGYQRVTSVNGNRINEWRDMGCNSYIQEFEADPIPLTIELLIKLGFKKRRDGLTEGNQVFLEHDDNHDPLIMCEYNKDIIDACIYMDDTYYTVWLPHINNVHQIQNLYFILHGKELEVNL